MSERELCASRPRASVRGAALSPRVVHRPVLRWKGRVERWGAAVVRVCKRCGNPYPCSVARRRFKK